MRRQVQLPVCPERSGVENSDLVCSRRHPGQQVGPIDWKSNDQLFVHGSVSVEREFSKSDELGFMGRDRPLGVIHLR